MMEKNMKKILIVVVLIFLAVVSLFPVADRMTTAETYGGITASIDDKAETVLKLTAASTVASAGISAIPGDTATPIAEKLADFTEYFLLILSMLYAEKYLLTIISAGVFKILIPLICLLLAISVFWNPQSMKRLAAKVGIFAVVLLFAIPLSIKSSDLVYRTYENSINETITSAEEFSQDTAELSEAGQDQGRITTALKRLTQSVTELCDRAAEILNRFVESLAVLIVTSCVIPLLVLVFFLWLIRAVTGVQIAVPVPLQRLRL